MSDLFRVPILDDEILPSFVSRFARANGNVAFMFCRDLGIDHDKATRGDPEHIGKLAELCGIDIATLAHHAVGLGSSLQVSLLGVKFEKPSVVKGTMRFCPDCFLDDEADVLRKPGVRRYMRAAWLARDVRSCPKHDREIVSLEPTVGSRYVDFCETLDRRDVEINNLSASAARMIAAPVEHYITRRLDGHRGYQEFIDKLELRVVIHLSRRLGVALKYGTVERLKELSATESATALSIGFEHLLGGENGLVHALDEVVKAQGVPELGTSVYGRLYKAFMIKREDSGYDTIRKILRRHAEQAIVFPGRTLTKDDAEKSQWTSVAAIVRATGLDKRFIRKRIQEDSTLVSDDGIVSSKALQIFSEISDLRVNIKEAANILGSSKSIVVELEEMGLLTRCDIGPNSPKIARQHRKFLRSDIVDLHSQILGRVTTVATSGLKSIVNLGAMFELQHSSIIADVLRGEFEVVANCGKRSLVDALMLDPNHYAPRYRLEGHASLDEACQLLDMNRWTLSLLMDAGVIPHTPHPLMARRKMIALSDIEDFNDRYVRLSRIGSRAKLLYRCRELGIIPVFPPEVAGQSFYVHRADVGKILGDD